MAKKQNIAILAGLGAAAAGVLALILKPKAKIVPPPPSPGLATLYGVVTNAKTGRGISGVTISLDGYSTTTDAQGNYSTENISLGSYAVTFEKKGSATLTDEVTLIEGLNTLDIQLAPITSLITPSLGVFQILDIEGVPFSKVFTEEEDTTTQWTKFGQKLQEFYGPYTDDWGYHEGYIAYGVGLALCMMAKGATCKSSTVGGYGLGGAELYQCGIEHPEYLTPGGQTLWQGQTNPKGLQQLVDFTLIHMGDFQEWETFPRHKQVTYYTLREPIVMSKMRGVTLHCIANTPESWSPGWSPWITFNYLVYLWYEPAEPTAFTPPAFRGGDRYPLPGEIDIPVEQCFGGGYFYPGIYNGKLQLHHYYDGYNGAIEGELRIKNLVRVTGEGTVVP